MAGAMSLLHANPFCRCGVHRARENVLPFEPSASFFVLLLVLSTQNLKADPFCHDPTPHNNMLMV